jgi:hypothetical protein
VFAERTPAVFQRRCSRRSMERTNVQAYRLSKRRSMERPNLPNRMNSITAQGDLRSGIKCRYPTQHRFSLLGLILALPSHRF